MSDPSPATAPSGSPSSSTAPSRATATTVPASAVPEGTPTHRCAACGYALDGPRRCPECGTHDAVPIRRPGEGWRWRTRRTVAGRPLVAVAWGPRGSERIGVAAGVVACGDRARGLIAVGSDAAGVLAIGGVCRGVLSFGGLAIGLASGGLAAFGALAVGWLAIGYLAVGSAAVGCYAGGGAVAARYSRVGDGELPADVPGFVAAFEWIFASWPAAVLFPLVLAAVVVPAACLAATVLLQLRWRAVAGCRQSGRGANGSAASRPG